MKNVITGALLSVIICCYSCSKEKINGGGPVVTETRTVSGFTTVSAEGSSRVFITQGNNFEVKVKGYSNLLPYYETRLENNILHLGYRSGVNVKHDNIEVYVTLPTLDGIRLSGSGDIRTSGAFNGSTLFEASIAGSGNIFFSSGTTQQFNSTIAGSGNIFAIDMLSNKADVRVDGSGNTEIGVASELKVTITGSGNVYYRGTPVITTQITGSGTVLPR